MVVRLKSAESWADDYAEVRPLYVSFVERFERLILDLLAEQRLGVIQTESRAKDVESFLEKVRSKSFKYSNPLADVTDLAGLRIITYYKEDVDVVQAILDREFEIDWKNSMDKGAQLDPDRFGYLSRHFVVRLRAPRTQLKEWKPFADLFAEVQVRTALQHAWAAVNHKLEYKTEQEVPLALKRRLNRLSALFEIADDEFSSFGRASSDVSSAYDDLVQKGELEIELDLDSLESYLDSQTDRLNSLREMGMEFELELLNLSQSDTRQRDRRDLLRIARAAGMQTVADLDRFMWQDLSTIRPILRAIDLVSEGKGYESGPETIEDVLSQVLWMQNPLADEEASEIYQGVQPEWIEEVRHAARQAPA